MLYTMWKEPTELSKRNKAVTLNHQFVNDICFPCVVPSRFEMLSKLRLMRFTLTTPLPGPCLKTTDCVPSSFFEYRRSVTWLTETKLVLANTVYSAHSNVVQIYLKAGQRMTLVALIYRAGGL